MLYMMETREKMLYMMEIRKLKDKDGKIRVKIGMENGAAL